MQCSGRFLGVIGRDPSGVLQVQPFTCCWHPLVFPLLIWGIFFYEFIFQGVKYNPTKGLYFQPTTMQCSGRFLGIIGWDPHGVLQVQPFTCCWHPSVFPLLIWGIFFYKFFFQGVKYHPTKGLYFQLTAMQWSGRILGIIGRDPSGVLQVQPFTRCWHPSVFPLLNWVYSSISSSFKEWSMILPRAFTSNRPLCNDREEFWA